MRRAPTSPEQIVNAAAMTSVTEQGVHFIEPVRLKDLPAEALRIGRRCALDGLGLFVAGCAEQSIRILVEEAKEQGGRKDALLLGAGDALVPAPLAAPVLETARRVETLPHTAELARLIQPETV